MASFFGSPPFLSHPLTRTIQFSSSSSQTPPPPPPNTPPSQPQSPSPSQQLSTTSSEQQTPISLKSQQNPPKPTTSTTSKVESTDWIASSLTRRFGLGAGLAWVAFLAVGVVSEQIKTRFEVSQEEANTRSVLQLIWFIYFFFISD